MAELNEDSILEIVKRAQNGDDDAFEMLFRRFGRPLYGSILRMVGDRDAAEDLLQDLFIKIHKKLRSFSHRSTFYTWAYRIAVNMTLNYLKSRPSRKETPLEPSQWEAIPSADDGEQDAAFVEEATRAAIQKVPPKQRAVLIMRVYDGLDYASIARTLGCSQGAAKANFHFAMQKMRKYLEDYR